MPVACRQSWHTAPQRGRFAVDRLWSIAGGRGFHHVLERILQPAVLSRTKKPALYGPALCLRIDQIHACRHFIPCSSFKYPSRLLFLHSTPLLKEEGNLRPLTLVANIGYPSGIKRPRSWTGFAADNRPIDTFEIEAMQRT